VQARKQTSIKVDPRAWSEVKEIFKEYNLTVSDAIINPPTKQSNIYA